MNKILEDPTFRGIYFNTPEAVKKVERIIYTIFHYLYTHEGTRPLNYTDVANYWLDRRSFDYLQRILGMTLHIIYQKIEDRSIDPDYNANFDKDCAYVAEKIIRYIAEDARERFDIEEKYISTTGINIE